MDEMEAQVPWPENCCVPAFLESAISVLANGHRNIYETKIRRHMAQLIGVTLAPDQPNPWGLRTSNYIAEQGVSVKAAKASVPGLIKLLGANADISLDVIPLNTIAFEMYEDVVLELNEEAAIVGIAFDFRELARFSSNSWPVPVRRAHHVVRLTPLEEESQRQPNIQSKDFRFDYSGSIWVFDDSLAMRVEESLVPWQDLMRACRSIDGAFWAVRRV
jgi:hypothetical protein